MSSHIVQQGMEELEDRALKSSKELREMLPPKVDMMDLIGSADRTPFGRDHQCLVWGDPEPYIIDNAASVIESLLAEVRQLRANLEDTLPKPKHGFWKPYDICSVCDTCVPQRGEVCPTCKSLMDL